MFGDTATLTVIAELVCTNQGLLVDVYKPVRGRTLLDVTKSYLSRWDGAMEDWHFGSVGVVQVSLTSESRVRFLLCAFIQLNCI